MSHGHSHGSGCCNCDDGFEIATDFALHTKISECGFECLGEEIEDREEKYSKIMKIERIEKSLFNQIVIQNFYSILNSMEMLN